jgi:WD40 repeat protein
VRSTGERKGNLPGNKSPVEVVRNSPDGTLITVAGWDGMVAVWDAATRQRVCILGSPGAAILALAFTPDGKYLLARTEVGPLQLWDRANWSELATIEAHDGNIRAIAFSRDGKMMAMAGHDRTVKLWDAP